MKLPRRIFLHLAAGAAALPVVSRIAWAQAYPSRPLRCIVAAKNPESGAVKPLVDKGKPPFRTIQVRPKDLLACLGQDESAKDQLAGPGRAVIIGGAYPRGGSLHVEREATRVHHRARRRGSVAARSARAAVG